MIKVEHHYLYLVAPYGALLGWLLVITSARFRWQSTISIALLTAAWMLGEGAVTTIAFVGGAISFAIWRSDKSRALHIITHVVCAYFIMFIYLGYQWIFIRDSSLHQRAMISVTANSAYLLHKTWNFAFALWETILEFLGFSFYDPEFQAVRKGFGVLNMPATYFIFVALLIILIVTEVRRGLRERPSNSGLIWPILALPLGSAFLIILVAFATNVAIAPRYLLPLCALLPISVVVFLSHYLPRVARYSAAFGAAACLSLFVVSLARAEILVSEKNRAAIIAYSHLRESGKRIIILEHEGRHPENIVGLVNGAYPGLGSPLWISLPDPLLAAWTANLALQRYTGIKVGVICHRDTNGILYGSIQGMSWRFRPDEAISIGLDHSGQKLASKELRCLPKVD